MSLGNGFYFAIGALATVALLFVLYPWLAGKPRVALLSAVAALGADRGRGGAWRSCWHFT